MTTIFFAILLAIFLLGLMVYLLTEPLLNIYFAYKLRFYTKVADLGTAAFTKLNKERAEAQHDNRKDI